METIILSRRCDQVLAKLFKTSQKKKLIQLQSNRCLQQGALVRTKASKVNGQSSRSHAFFTIIIRQNEILTSKFHFVDLAGFERFKGNGTDDSRTSELESAYINESLYHLRNVITALSKNDVHIPYTNSILTRMLQNSLGGNSETVLIACISSSKQDCIETINTLVYANSARDIKNRLHVNKVPCSTVPLKGNSLLRGDIAGDDGATVKSERQYSRKRAIDGMLNFFLFCDFL